MANSSEDLGSMEDASGETNASNSKNNAIIQRIGRPPKSHGGNGTISDLKELYKSKSDEPSE